MVLYREYHGTIHGVSWYYTGCTMELYRVYHGTIQGATDFIDIDVIFMI